MTDQSLYGGITPVSRGLAKEAQNSSADTGFLGPQYYPLTVQTSFNIFSQWHLAPYLGYTILPRGGADSGEKINLLMLGLPFYQDFDAYNSAGFDWDVGPTFIMTSTQGGGGTVILNNGSSTANFGLPGATRQSINVAVQLGIGYNFSSMHIALDTLTEGLFSNNRRTYSLMLSLLYNFLGN